MADNLALDAQEIRSKLTDSQSLIQHVRRALAVSRDLFDKRDLILGEIQSVLRESRTAVKTASSVHRVHRNKGGRRKLPKGQAHGYPIQVRLREDDYKAFQHSAKSNGQTLSEWIRASLRAAATSQEILLRLVR